MAGRASGRRGKRNENENKTRWTCLEKSNIPTRKTYIHGTELILIKLACIEFYDVNGQSSVSISRPLSIWMINILH